MPTPTPTPNINAKLRELYDYMSADSDNDMGSLDEFNGYMQNEGNRRKLYDYLNSQDENDVGSFNDFSKALGFTNAPAKDKDVRAYEETHQGGGQTTGHSDGGSWLGDAWNTGMGYLKKAGEAIHDAVTPVQQAVVRNANVNGNVGVVSPRGEQQVRKGDGVPSLTSQPSSRAAVSSAHPGDVKAGQAHAAEQKETVPVIEIGPLQNGAGNEIDDGSNGYLAVNGRTTGGQFVSSDKIGREAVSSMDDSWSQHTFTYQGAERRADEIYKDVYQQYADAYNKALHEQEAAGRGNTEGTYTTAYSVIQKLKDEGVSSAVLDPVDEMFTRNRLKEILVPAVNDFVPEGDNNFLSKRLPAMWYDQMFQSNLRSTAQALGYTTDKQYGDFLREQVKPMLDGLLRNRTGQGLSDSGGGQLYENWEAIQKEIGAHPRFETEQQFMSDQLGELQDDIKQQLSAAHRRNMSSSNPIEFLGFDDDEPLLRTADDLLSKSRDLVNEAQAGNFLSGAWKGFANKAFSWDNWDLGLSDLPDNFRISSVLDKADKDPNSLTQAENSLLDAVVMHSAIGNYFRAGYGAEAGAVTAEAIPFMLEMALNPAGKAGSKLSEKLMRWAQRRYAGSYYAKLAEALSKARLAKAARTGEEGVMLTVAERNAVKRELQQARGMINGAGEMSRGRRVVTLLGKPIKGAVEYGVSGAALTATTGAPRVVAGAVGRKNNLDNVDFDYQDGKIVYSGRKDDGETWLSAVGKAFGDVWIENTSEYLGDAQIGKWFGGWLKLADNTAVGKFMGAVGSKGKKVLTDLGDTLHLNQVASWLETTDLGRLGNGLREFEKRAQYHGVIGEYKEEVMGNIMNAALVGDNNFRLFDDNGKLNFGIDGSVFNAEDNLRTFIGVSLMGGIMSTAKGGSYLYDKGRNKRSGLDNLSTLALESANGKISASEWSLIRERLEHGEEDDIVTVLKSLYNDYDLTTDQLSKIYGFASATLYQRGVTSARDKMQQEQEGTIEGDVQDSFDMGYDLINNPMQAVTARHRYEKALDNVSGLLSENWLDYIDSNPEEALTQLAQSDLDSADQEDIVEYINAKAVYDGIQTRINDDVASAQQRVHNYWQRRTNRETGEIEQVELTDGRTVFVVDRGMSGLEDRNPDADNAESWIVCNEDGELEFVSPDDVLTEEEAPRTQQADEVIANEQEAEENEIRAKGDDAITYGMTFDTGGSYYLADEQNVIHQYEIISDDGDGMLTVRVDGSEQSQQMSKEQFALLFGAMPANNEEQQEGAAMPSRGTEEGEPVGEPTGTVAGEPTVAMVEGAPEDYTPDMELTIRNDDGSETPAMVMGRVRYENGEFVPDENGNIVEYLMDGEVHHDNISALNDKVVSYVPAQSAQETAHEAHAVQEESNIAEPVIGTSAQESNISEPPTETPVTTPTEPQPTEQITGQPATEPMPMREDGEEDWQAATPERAHAYIFNEAGLSRSEGNEFIAANIDAANKALVKAKSAQMPRVGTSIKKYNEAKAKRQEKIDEAQRVLDYWNGVREIQNAIQREENERRAAEDAVRHDEAVAEAQAEYEARKQAEAERKAVGNENPMPAITEKWNNATKVDGHRDEIMLPDGTPLKGHYVLHESGASSPSHNPETWQKTDGFPMDANDNSVNDRDYERDHDAQEHTQSIARQYDQRALQSVPVVSNDGVVLSGNGRTMAGELAARDNTDGAYVNYLKEYASKFGFTPEQVEAMQHPRVSFVPDEAMPYTAETFAKFNQQEMKSQNKTEQAVKLGKTVSDDSFKGIVRTINGYDTLGDFYNDAEASLGAVYDLHNAGVVPQAQLAEMVDGIRGQERLSAVGREFLENMLIGKAFEGDPDVVRMLTAEPAMRQTVITALGEIADNIALGDGWSLQGELADAVKLCFDARQDGAKYGDIVSIHARQGVLFADPDQLQTVADFNNATMLMLADVLNDKRVTLLKTTLQLYNNNARQSASGQTDLFAGGIQSREDILSNVINYIKENYGKRKEIEAARAEAVERRKAESVQQDGTPPAVSGGSEDAGGSERGTEETPTLTHDEAISLIARMEERANVAPEIELTIENWDAQFGEDGRVSTPIGEVKMGEHQFTKLMRQGREGKLGMIKPTLETPDVIIEDASEAKEGDVTERNSSYVFVKAFKKADGSRYYYFTSITVSKYGREVVVSNQEKSRNRLLRLMTEGKMLWRTPKDATTASVEQQGLDYAQPSETETATKGSGMTPQSTDMSPSVGKGSDNISNDQEKSGKNAGKEQLSSDPWNGHEVGGVYEDADGNKARIVFFDYTNGDTPEVVVRHMDAEGNDISTEAIPPLMFEEEYKRAKTENGGKNQSPIQGLDGYTEDEVLSLVRGDIEEKLADAGIDGVTLKGMALHGSRLRGDASEDSDLDVVVEYEGNMSEDGLFNILNDEPMEIEGVRVDVNPITSGKSGTLDQYMERSRQFDALKKAELETDTEPTEAQKEAGNYKKGHVKIDGYDVTIENPKGSVRRGTDASGKQWEQEMQNTYGYIRGTEGVDGDHIDVFFSEDPSQGDVFVVDQVNKDGSFDEHKVMYGFPDIESARKAYLSNYEDGWQGLGAITPVSKDEFKKWIDSSHRKTKPFAEYSSVKPLGDTHPDNVAIPSQRTEEAEQQPKVEIKTGEDYVSAAERIAKEQEIKATAAHFPMETTDEASAFDKGVSGMSDAELLMYMREDGKGDVNKSHHPSVYDEYDYRHGDEQLQSYDDTLVRLNESGTTLEQAEEMLANLQKDKTRFATEDRAELLGQEDALQDYIEGLEKIVPGHDLQEHIDTLAALQDNGKDYNKNAYDAYAAGRRFGNGVNKELTKKEAIALAHKMVDENYARGGVYILPFLDGVGDSVDLRLGRNKDEVSKREKEYQAKKSGLPNEAEASTLGSSAKISSADSESPVATNKSLAGSATSVSAGKGTDLFGNEQGKGKKSSPDAKIDDVGERLEGARKDMRRKIAESLANVTEADLIEKPFGKVYKKPDLKKAVESGALREKDAIFYEALFSMVNQQKPKVTQSEMRSKRYIPDFKTKAERWAADTFKQMEVLRQFMELDEPGRDAMMERMLADRYPTREQELAEIEKRKGWNPDREDHKYEWGEMTTPNPLWVVYEVMNRLGYNIGDKLDVPFGVVVANVSGTGYGIENLKGERHYTFGSKMTLDEAIDRIVYLAKLKRGDADVSHPTQLFAFPATKSESGESGRYRVMWGRDYKTREFDSKDEADAFAQTKNGAYVSPIMETKRKFGYKVRFTHPLTGEKMFVDDTEFDTKEEAQAYFDGNFEKLNEATNAKLQEEREKKGEKKTLTADDVVHVTMVRSAKGVWTHAVVIDKKYANNDGQVRIIKEGFASRKDAKSFADSVKDAVLKTVLKHKEDAKKIVYFDTGENSRIGEDYRNGKNVDAEDFMNTFGFRGVQFGNWTNQADRQMAVNQAYDAFMDMARLIGVSPKAMSLNGELGIAFGARGVGGFAAHYEPGEVVINLTKTQGAGSLAHEWWHALDNYFARRAGSAGDMVTDNRRIEMRDALRKAFNDMLDLVKGSDYAQRSAAKGEYWGRTHEITARLLAEWVDRELKKRGELNTFLSRGAVVERGQQHNYDVYEALERLAGREPMPFEEYKELPESLKGIPYPSAKEVEQFGGSLRHIFDTLEEKVDEETGNVMLYEPTATYETRDGGKFVCRSLFDEMGVRSSDEVAMVSQHTQQGQGQNQVIAPSEIRLRKLKKGETCHVERVYEETKQFDFTGKEKVESAEDVAYIFRQLENAAVENSFLVLVKDGRPTVIHLGLGSYVTVMAPYEQAFVAYRELKPEQVYFVHNHPSGVLKASRQDQELLKRVKMAFGPNIVQPGIIIDTTSGKYGEFDMVADNYDLVQTSGVEAMPQSEGADVPVKVYQFSRQVFSPDWNPESAFKIVSSQSVAEFVSSHRLGEHKKMSFLVVNNSGNVVANVFLPWTKLSDIKRSKDAGDLLVGYVHQCGGVRGVLYGNYDYEPDDQVVLAAVGGRMRQLNAPLMDALHVEHSALESGWSGVGEPEEGYGVDATPFHNIIDEMFDNEDFDKSAHARERYDLGATPEWMKSVGITGDRFSLSFKNIKTHQGKDADHNLTREEWHQLPEAIKMPFLVTKRKDTSDKFRLYVNILHNGHYVAVGVDVKRVNQGKNKPMLEVNSIKTVFGHKEKLSANEVVLTYDKNITPEQEALLRGLDYREYPTIQELSAAKVGNNSDIAKENGENVVEDTASYRIVDDPELLNELEDGEWEEAEYVTDKMIADMNEKAKRGMPQTPEAKRTEAERLAKKFNTPINIIEDVNEITHPNAEIQEQRRRAKGWYDKVTRRVYVVLPNNRNVEDVAATVFHETVGHKGLRELIGDDNYNDFLREVYEHLKVNVRRRIVKLAEKHNWDFEKATDEYLSRLAEKGFEDFDREERSVWQWLKEKVVNAINKFLQSLKLPKWVKLGDNELRYILWRSKERLERGKEHPIDLARDIVKREELGLTDEARYNMGDSRRRSEREKTNYAIDSAVSFVTGRDIKAVREERRRKEHDRKALATEIYEKVLSGDINAVPLQQINDYINDSTPDNRYGRPLSQRLPQRVERALYARTPENAIDALYSRICEGSVPSLGRVSASARRAVEERKKELLEVWAKASGNWHTDLSDYTDDHNPIGHGTDSDVYLSKDGAHVIKLSKGKPYGKRFRPDIDNVAIFNAIFPNSAYHILGYGDFGKGFVRILEQPFIDFPKVTPLTPSEREEYMGSLGFHPINDEKTAFSNGEIIVADLQKGNIVKDAAGNITVIDADCKFHTKDLGGNYSYPPVENDVLHGDTSRAAGSAAHPDMTDEDTAFYRDPDETEDIWNDQSMGLKERITAASIRWAEKHRDDKTLRNEAMRAISDNLADLRKAMSLQRQFDMTTVKRVADLVRVLMNSGYISGATQQEVKRLLAAVKNSVGHNDIESSVQKVMDIMVDNRLKHAEEALRTLERTKATKVDAKGVEVQGELDLAGQVMMKAFKDGRRLKREALEEEIGKALDWMSSESESVREDAENAYVGLQFALQYAACISDNKHAEKVLRDELKKKHDETSERDRMTDSYRQYVVSMEDAIRQKKIERAQAYHDLVAAMTDGLRESMANAKAFKESERKRVESIRHFANSDMHGMELRGQRPDSRLDRWNENGLLRLGLSPLHTFDQFMRLFGRKNADGKGYLYDHYVRKYIDSADHEQLMKEKYEGKLEAKVKELFGTHKVAGGLRKVSYTYTSLYGYVDALPMTKVTYYDGAGKREYELSQAQLAYLYMVDKMPMGKATNRGMGVTEEVIEQIEGTLDAKLKEFADWVQEEFLVELGNECNEVHKRMFGANMDSIENYFPFVRDKNAIKREVENGAGESMAERISTKTGAIIKRTPSVANWDMPNANFLDILAKHVSEMCQWSSYAELNRDLGTLQSFNRFKQQVLGMRTIYGSGEQLWKRFMQTCAIVGNAYEPKRGEADKLMVQGAKGVVMGKIAFRPMTAMKQLLSLPAFFGEVDMECLSRDFATGGIASVKWAWENMPNFRKRIKSRTAGDFRLSATKYDKEKGWTNTLMRISAYGMLPNIGVDAWTIALGSHAVYVKAKKKYLRQGYSEEKAERRAVQDAELCFNKSQQSSEGAFMAPVQIDHTFASTTMMLFRNSSTSYTRECVTSVRNLKRMMSGEVDVDFMAKQILRNAEIPTFSMLFDAELQRQVEGTLPVGHIYSLGMPGGVLQSAGFPDAPIELSSTRLAEKSSDPGHPFPIEALKGLVDALNNPVAVFNYGNNAMNVIVGLEYKGKHFLVGVHFNQQHRGTSVSDIRGLFPKDNAEWLNWVSQGKARYLDHKRIKALIAQQRINLAEVDYLDLKDVAKVMKSFVNPSIPEQKYFAGWRAEDVERAREQARKEYRSGYIRNSVNAVMFGYILPWLWRIGGLSILLALGDDDDDKKSEVKKASKQSLFGPLEGIAYGDVIADGLYVSANKLFGDGTEKFSNLGRTNPFLSDLADVLRKLDGDKLAAVNDVLNMLVGMKTGVNLQTVSDWATAILDYSPDGDTAREVSLLVSRLLNAPQSQIEKIYFDEIGMSGDEALRLSPRELVERYAQYKVKRGHFVTPWVWGDEDLLDNERKRGKTIVKERIGLLPDEALEWNFNTDDNDLRKEIGKEYAKRHGAEDTYGSVKSPGGQVYASIRDYVDLAEDIQLQQAQLQAEAAGDTERAKEISKARTKISNIKKDFTDGSGSRQDVLDKIRKERRSAINEYCK